MASSFWTSHNIRRPAYLQRLHFCYFPKIYIFSPILQLLNIQYVFWMIQRSLWVTEEKLLDCIWFHSLWSRLVNYATSLGRGFPDTTEKKDNVTLDMMHLLFLTAFKRLSCDSIQRLTVRTVTAGYSYCLDNNYTLTRPSLVCKLMSRNCQSFKFRSLFFSH